MSCAFRTNKYGKNVWSGKSRERESSYGDSKRWVRHETGEGEMERCDRCETNIFGTLEPCVHVTRKKMCEMTVHARCAETCACDM